jgi:hypothetical protein
VCGVRRVYAHHDDYNYPLDITWMCAPHHAAWHKLFIPTPHKLHKGAD